MDNLSLVRIPLYAKVRESLRELVMEHFADGDRFFSEPDLIERLGVSQGTVRRALGDLADEGLLIRKVPHGTFVRKLRTDRFAIGVFMPRYDSPFLMEVLEKFSQECRQQKLLLRLYHTHHRETIDDTLQQMHSPPSEERILLLGETPRVTHELCVSMKKRGYHIVSVDTLTANEGVACVAVDNEAGIRIGMEHLLSLGHRRLTLLVNEPREAYNVHVRVEAFERLAKKYNLTQARVVDCGTKLWGNSYEAAFAQMGDVMSADPRPTAIFAVSDAGAWSALKWLNEHGIKVPAEVSVLGFDDDRPSQYLYPALSTLRQPIEDLVSCAVKLLSAKTRGGSMHLLPPTLVVRQSTGPAAS